MPNAQGSNACRTVAATAVSLLIVVVAVAVPRLREPSKAMPAGSAATSVAASGEAGPSAAPRVFRYFTERPSSLDPGLASDAYSAMVISQIFSPLVGLTSDLAPVPQMAESWTISPDGLTYVFHLRKRVRFHTGREVTAADFVYSLTRLFKEPLRSQGLAAGYLDAIVGVPEFECGKAEGISGIRAIDPLTLEIRLSRPYGALLSALALDQTSVVPRETVDSNDPGPFADNPVGCGPFRFAYRRGEDVIVLAANPDYFLGRPAIDSILFYTPQGNVETQGADALSRGETAMANLPVSLLEEFKGRPNVRVVRWQDLSTSFIGMNTTMAPFDDPRVRQAVALAMNRDAMLNLWPAGKVLSQGILPPGLPGFSPEQKVYDRDVAAARRLLAAAGYGPSNPLPALRLCKSGSTESSRQIDTVMVNSLAEAGIRVDLQYVRWSELDSLITGRHAQMFGLAWVADIPDPDTFLRSLFYSSSGTNYFRYSDQAVDSLLDLARRTADPEIRMNAYHTAERAIVEAAPLVPLFHSSTFIGLRNDVSGLEVNPLGISTLAMEKLRIGNPSSGREQRQAIR